jgi:pyruvate dehydrogenase E2 component (dihydrolipoamide acetyltransferase)
MAYVVVMPRMGQTMEEGAVVEWKKKEGDTIDKGEVLLTIQSDKAELEVEADYSGTLVKILVTPDDGEVACLEPIAIMAAPGETVDAGSVLEEFLAKRRK